MRKKIFICGPYHKNEPGPSITAAIHAADKLAGIGYVSYIPQLNFFYNMVHWLPEEAWLDVNCEWLLVCDGLLRLPGKSKSADKYMELAKEVNIPIFHSFDEILKGFA